MYCRSCRYSLRGLEANRCPECGLIFEPGDPRTFARFPTSPRRAALWATALLLVVAAVMIAVERGPVWLRQAREAAAARQLERDKALVDAIIKHDVAAVTAALDSGANANYAQSNGWTPLIHAAHRNQADVVKVLLGRGANVNAVSRDGNNASALLYVVGGDDKVETVKALVTAGADVNARHGQRGYTALSTASRHGAAKTVKYLIERGADVNVAGNNGVTPLAWARQEKQPEMVDLLLEAGAKDSAAADLAVKKIVDAARPKTPKRSPQQPRSQQPQEQRRQEPGQPSRPVLLLSLVKLFLKLFHLGA